eukprot:9502142-Pyramimonas_sp.AAC.1
MRRRFRVGGDAQGGGAASARMARAFTVVSLNWPDAAGRWPRLCSGGGPSALDAVRRPAAARPC